jgi:hypothetical protein
MFSAVRLTVGQWVITQWAITLCFALGLPSIAASAEPSPAREFSADIVTRDAAGLTLGTAARLHVANHKVRIETPEAPAGFFLIDGDAGTFLFVQPAQQVFMDAKQSTRLTQIFVPVDPNDPCRQWRAAATNAAVPSASASAAVPSARVPSAGVPSAAVPSVGDWRCERMDAAGAGHRGTIEYRVVFPDHESSQRWIDPTLEFPVRQRAADGTTTVLEHIRIETQAASLFTVPPGSRKFDPQALIDRIKHSDVWAGHPSP